MTVSYDPVESSSAAWVSSLKAAIQAATGEAVYEVDEFPANFPARYCELHLSPRFVESLPRAGGMRDDRGWRLSLRVVSKDVGNARLMFDRIARRFRAPVVLDGVDTWVRFAGSDDFDRDDVYFQALTDWEFVR